MVGTDEPVLATDDPDGDAASGRGAALRIGALADKICQFGPIFGPNPAHP